MSGLKTIKITAVNRIERDGIINNPGKSFDCEEQEARRLIGLEAAKPAEPEARKEEPPAPPDESTIALIEAIEAAATYEEVLALMPEEEPDAEIAAAFEAKLAILKG